MNKGNYGFPSVSVVDTTLPDGVMKLIANTAVTKGDLVCSWTSGISRAPISTGISEIPGQAALGSLVGAITSVESATNAPLQVAALRDGGFVAAYSNSSVPKFARYNASGVLQGSLTTVESVSSSMTAVAGLSDGGFVVAYRNDSSHPRFARYNASGVLQGSLTTVESNSTNRISVASLSDGGFVIGYTNSNQPRFARYNASGVLQGSLTTVEGINATRISVAGLSDGFVVVYAVSGNTKFVRYNTSGVAQSSGTVEATSASEPEIGVTGLPLGGFVVTFLDSNNYPRFARYNASGTIQGSPQVVEAVASLSALGVSTLLDGSGFVVVYRNASNHPRFARYSTSGVLQGSLTTVESSAIVQISASGLPNGEFVVLYTTGELKFARYNGALMTILGVAINSASAGGVLYVRFGGEFGRPISELLNTNIGHVVLTWDNKAAGGCAGSLINNTAYLRGLA